MTDLDRVKKKMTLELVFLCVEVMHTYREPLGQSPPNGWFNGYLIGVSRKSLGSSLCNRLVGLNIVFHTIAGGHELLLVSVLTWVW